MSKKLDQLSLRDPVTGDLKPTPKQILRFIQQAGVNGAMRSELMVACDKSAGSIDLWCRAMRIEGMIETARAGVWSRWCLPGLSSAVTERTREESARRKGMTLEKYLKEIDRHRAHGWLGPDLADEPVRVIVRAADCAPIRINGPVWVFGPGFIQQP